MAHRRIPLSALRVGMHVAKIDRPWFWSPLLFHSFLIRTSDQIDKLRRHGITEVEIDPARGLDVEDASASDMSRQPVPNSPAGHITRAAPIRSLHNLSQELQLARQARQRLEESLRATFANIAATGTVDSEEARKIVLEMSVVTQTLALPALFMALTQAQSDDPFLSQHSLSICGLSMLVAHASGFDLVALHTVATGALLHDIGLLQLPAYLRHRCHETSAPLSRQEQLLYQSHARLSAVALQRHGSFPASVCQLVADHHALLDNSGFPAETSGAFTTDLTRIVMVVDRYDELLRGFGGASPLTPHQALQRLYHEGQAGKYDGRYIATLIRLLGIYPVYTAVELNTGERAIVTVVNSRKLHLPVVTITHDAVGIPYPVPVVLDLANQGERAPARVIAGIAQEHPFGLDRTIAHAT